MSGQKVWAQKTADGKYAMVYDPTLESTHRWPMCVTTSEDGIAYENMLLVHGEVPPMRFGGFWKDYGPQYMRGIAEGIERPDDCLWIAYTVNKEDVWVARLPLPITGEERERELKGGFEDFTVYSPKWAPVTMTEIPSLRLADFDRYDYGKAERVLREAVRLELDFTVIPRQKDHGTLYCELQDVNGQTAVRLVFREDGMLCLRTTALIPCCPYEADREVRIRIWADCGNYDYALQVDEGERKTYRFMTAVERLGRFVLRTGAPRRTPDRETAPVEDEEYALPMADEKEEAAVYDMTSFWARSKEDV